MRVVGVPVKYLTTPSDKTNSDITHFVYNFKVLIDVKK